jgi:hypothetical protein
MALASWDSPGNRKRTAAWNISMISVMPDIAMVSITGPVPCDKSRRSIRASPAHQVLALPPELPSFNHL